MLAQKVWLNRFGLNYLANKTDQQSIRSKQFVQEDLVETVASTDLVGQMRFQRFGQKGLIRQK